jgi:hypothetical protein
MSVSVCVCACVCVSANECRYHQQYFNSHYCVCVCPCAKVRKSHSVCVCVGSGTRRRKKAATEARESISEHNLHECTRKCNTLKNTISKLQQQVCSVYLLSWYKSTNTDALLLQLDIAYKMAQALKEAPTSEDPRCRFS